MNKRKYSAGLWIYGAVPDRYLPGGYQPLADLEDRLQMIANTRGIDGVEIPYGPVLNQSNIDTLPRIISDMGLEISSMGVNVTGDRKWGFGSISNPDKSVRTQAKELIKESMQAAKKIGVGTINLWMGQEGFDYPFECDYAQLWEYMSEGIAECAQSCREVNLSIEYKCMEPRARNLPNSAAQALLLARETGCDNVGVTIDFGHALIGKENASQSVALLNKYNKLFYLHINDNYGDWDWDMAAGVDHWWQLVEFCYWINRIDFNNWLVVDIFPYRHNAVEMTEVSVLAMEKAFSMAEKLDKEMVEQALLKREPAAIFKTLFK